MSLFPAKYIFEQKVCRKESRMPSTCCFKKNQIFSVCDVWFACPSANSNAALFSFVSQRGTLKASVLDARTPGHLRTATLDSSASVPRGTHWKHRQHFQTVQKGMLRRKHRKYWFFTKQQEYPGIRLSFRKLYSKIFGRKHDYLQWIIIYYRTIRFGGWGLNCYIPLPISSASPLQSPHLK